MEMSIRIKGNFIKSKTGFSLVEILLSTAILAIGLGILLFSLTQGLQGAEIQYVSSEASELAHARLERIRARLHPENDDELIPFSQIMETIASGGYDQTYFTLTDTQGNGYLGQTEITALGTSPEMLIIDCFVCVRLKSGRVIGENQGWTQTSGVVFSSPFHLQTAMMDTSD